MPLFKALPTGTIVGDTDTQTLSNKSITGTATNDNAAAGAVGEYITASVAIGSATSISSNTAANLTSISLTAGDWDVWSLHIFIPATTTSVISTQSSISTTSNTMDSTLGSQTTTTYSTAGTVFSNQVLTTPLVRRRVSIASTTTVYLVGNANFGTSTMTQAGAIFARRVR